MKMKEIGRRLGGSLAHPIWIDQCHVCQMVRGSVTAGKLWSSVVDPGFSWGGEGEGTNSQSECANLLFCIFFFFFAQNCMKMTDFGPQMVGHQPRIQDFSDESANPKGRHRPFPRYPPSSPQWKKSRFLNPSLSNNAMQCLISLMCPEISVRAILIFFLFFEHRLTTSSIF